MTVTQPTQLSHRHWHYALFLVAVVVITFFPVLQLGPFPVDDRGHTLDNSLLMSFSWDSFLVIWREPYMHLYIPLAYSIWGVALNAAHALGLPPETVLHGLNLFLHILNSLLVFALAQRLRLRAPLAFVVALLFALHPIQVETVAWISCLRDLTSMSFMLTSALAFVRFRTSNRRIDLVWSFLSFIAALLCKPSAIVLPALLAIIDVWFLATPYLRSARTLALWLIPSGVIIFVTQKVQIVAGLDFIQPLPQRILVAFDSLGFYVKKFFWPDPLLFDYGRSPPWALKQPDLWLHICFALLCVALLIAVRKSKSTQGALGLFLVPLIPILGIVPFAFQGISTVADRYMYTPMLGAALVVGCGLERVIDRHSWTRRGAVAIASLLLLISCVLSFRQISSWRDVQTFAARALAVNPHSKLAFRTTANLFVKEPTSLEHLAFLEQGLIHWPKDPKTHVNIGVMLHELGRTHQAITFFQKAMELDPTESNAPFNLAIALREIGAYDQSHAAFAKAQALGFADTDRLRKQEARVYLLEAQAFEIAKQYEAARAARARAAALGVDQP